MTPSARAQAAIDILDAWLAGGDGLDRILVGWGRAHRFAGSKDRRAIADLVYDAVRRRRSAAWIAGGGEERGRDVLRGSLMLDGIEPATVFDGSRFGPPALGSGEAAPPRSLEDAPRAVKLDHPEWLAEALADVPDADLARLRGRAPLDLRVNLLKADRESAAAALAAEGIRSVPIDLAVTALRVVSGAPGVSASRAYADGLVEIQDAASQAVAALAAPSPGERMLDLCAGGGGKTLALAGAVRGRGTFLAHDVSPGRMRDLPARARRAGVDVRLVDGAALEAEAGRPDLVLVDAPCSGSGAWRRNPDAKWRLDPARLDELVGLQDALLDRAASLAAPGGRVVYATCSLLEAENAARTRAFAARRRGWRIARSRRFALADGGDGHFAAVLERGGPA